MLAAACGRPALRAPAEATIMPVAASTRTAARAPSTRRTSRSDSSRTDIASPFLIMRHVTSSVSPSQPERLILNPLKPEYRTNSMRIGSKLHLCVQGYFQSDLRVRGDAIRYGEQPGDGY